MIELNGAEGEGGGQILRTALTLSMITGRPFQIHSIRAGRNRPGLLRQHLTAVNAAAQICQAQVEGALLGSTRLSFTPGAVVAGDYQFAIGSAGSSSLVLQTLLPALAFASGPSSIRVSGGTHNKAAPPADFLQQVWLPVMQQMGFKWRLQLEAYGFYPAGGGAICAWVEPCGSLQALNLSERGPLQSLTATALVANLPKHIGQRELAELERELPAIETQLRQVNSLGPGNALLVAVQSANMSEVFSGFGQQGVSAEQVAQQVAKQVQQYLASSAAVGEYLADQLLLPLALAGCGCFTTLALSSHFKTNMSVIQRFLPVQIDTQRVAANRQLVQVSRN